VFQCPPGLDAARVFREELARAELAEALGFDEVWVPEQHFSPYCLAGDALLLAGHLAARTRRVHIGTAVVNLTFTHPLRSEVWVPEQHFSPYCLAGDALLLAGHLAARTRRVHIGTAVVNLTFTHPL